MDIADLKAKALAARTAPMVLGECSFTLLTPTGKESLAASAALGTYPQGTSMLMLLRRVLLEQALIGWQGPRVRDILPDDPEGNAPLAWSAETVPLLLEAQPEWADALGNELMDRMAARTQRIEADAKN